MTKSCQFMIFGATGDLTYLKLIPAIFSLYKQGELCPEFKLVCIGRKELDVDAYVLPIDEAVTKQLQFSEFKNHIQYIKMDFTDKEAYCVLKEHMMAGNWIFYLATAPQFFEIISGHLHDHYFLDEHNGFRRIIFEKPFGVDFHDAKKINKHITKILKEDQVYRIDHYLGKEMIQNILLTRAYNSFLEMLWHKDAIDYIEVVVSESATVKTRAGYYDHSGALKDMVQNHMFQMVALLGMDLPEVLIPEKIQVEKNKVLKQIKVTDQLVFGQYKGYLEEIGVAENSQTETFVAMAVEIQSKRWKGMPIYLKTGKALKDKYAQIVVHFKNMHYAKENVFVIKIQPEEGIQFKMNSKKPGVSNEMDTVTLDYCHSCLKYGDEPSAYGRLLLDMILGDKSLFASWEEIEASWSIIHSIKKPKALVYYDKHTEWDEKVVLEKGWWRGD